MSLRKLKEECTLSEYQFFWCEGTGHREEGTAMLPHTVCAGCAQEWYGTRTNRAIVDERAAILKIAVDVCSDADNDKSDYGGGYRSAATSIRMAIERRGG